MITKRRLCTDSEVAISEIAPNGAVHEILTKDGQIVRFFLKRREAMPEKYKRLYLENVDENIARVPESQRAAMRARAEEMAKELGIPI
jgi:hypothetical protein